MFRLLSTGWISISVCLFVAFAILVIDISPLSAQSCTGETEPNDQPAQATAIGGAGCINAELGESDQDIYRWDVDEGAAHQSWTFTLQGMPIGLTSVQLLRVTLAENGIDVAQSTKLYEFSVQRGAEVTVDPLLFIPGTYYIGVVAAGATGAYRLELQPGPALPAVGDRESTQDTPAPLPDAQADQVRLAGDLRGADDYFA